VAQILMAALRIRRDGRDPCWPAQGVVGLKFISKYMY